MKRDDWQDRVNTLLNWAVTRPFQWGEFDCCLFAADAVICMTGTDFGAPFRGRYTTQRGSVRALKRYGSGTIAATMTTLFGGIRNPLCAEPGDIALVDTPLGDALGLVYRGGIWVTGPDGLEHLPMRHAKGVWEVTCHQ